MKQIIINGTLFNLSWLAVVYSQSLPIAVLVVLIHLSLHAWLQSPQRSEWILIALVSALGIAVDQLIFAAGILESQAPGGLAPLWLSCLWPLLASCLCHAFAGLQQRPLLAALVGSVGGAFRYLAGTRLSSIEFGDPLAGPILIGLCWALLMPTLLLMASYLQQQGEMNHGSST